MNVAIIDYGSGNLHSAAKAFERAAANAGAHTRVVVTSDPDAVARADRIVLPGVGAYADCRNGLAAVSGMIDALNDAVVAKGRPFLGICVGMQLMATRGLEHRETPGLGWIPGDVVKLAPQGNDSPAGVGYRLPHMGWNNLAMRGAAHPVLAGLEGDSAYFVHSYHLKCADAAHCLAETAYGQAVTAVVGRDTMIGTQFHPEKSQRLGLALIGNFLAWSP